MEKNKEIIQEGLWDWITSFFKDNAGAKAVAAEKLITKHQGPIAEKLLDLYSTNPKALIACLAALPNIKDSALKQTLSANLFMFLVFHGKSSGILGTNAEKLLKSKDPDILKGAEAAQKEIERIKEGMK